MSAFPRGRAAHSKIMCICGLFLSARFVTWTSSTVSIGPPEVTTTATKSGESLQLAEEVAKRVAISVPTCAIVIRTRNFIVVIKRLSEIAVPLPTLALRFAITNTSQQKPTWCVGLGQSAGFSQDSSSFEEFATTEVRRFSSLVCIAGIFVTRNWWYVYVELVLDFLVGSTFCLWSHFVLVFKRIHCTVCTDFLYFRGLVRNLTSQQNERCTGMLVSCTGRCLIYLFEFLHLVRKSTAYFII